MKASKILTLLSMALFVTTAFAASNKTSVEIHKNVVVGGKTLPAGKYNVAWEGQGPNVDLSVSKGKELIVKTPAHLTDLPKTAAYNAVVTKDNPDGTSSLSQIQLGGKKYVLEISEPAQTDVASRAK